ncbi:hypothetical protein [Microbacterium sp. CH12i]|uniref:hypothetical protein n=1 Tax=Microbacterium sp. CH12i TaxID=1479651 RepID=UPI000A59C90F|nr:hypothetical protein [Microbacterium sp. CH12i]
MSNAEVASSDEYQGARPSRAMEIIFGVAALAFTSGFLALSTQIHLRREAAPGQIDARFWPLVLGVTASSSRSLSSSTRSRSPRPAARTSRRFSPAASCAWS